MGHYNDKTNDRAM